MKSKSEGQGQWRKYENRFDACLRHSCQLPLATRIQFKLAVVVYRALHGTAPQYLSDLLRRVADIPSRRRLRSSLTDRLDVRPYDPPHHCRRPLIVYCRPTLWNSLPNDITPAPSLPVFRRKLKAYLFQRSYLDTVYCAIVVA